MSAPKKEPRRVDGLDLRSVFPAAGEWTAEYYDPIERAWFSVPVVAWGVDFGGENHPLTTNGGCVLQAMHDAFAWDVRIVDPNGNCIEALDAEPSRVERPAPKLQAVAE